MRTFVFVLLNLIFASFARAQSLSTDQSFQQQYDANVERSVVLLANLFAVDHGGASRFVYGYRQRLDFVTGDRLKCAIYYMNTYFFCSDEAGLEQRFSRTSYVLWDLDGRARGLYKPLKR